MNPSTVILVAFFTSAVTATGTVLVLQKAGVIAPAAATSAASEPALVVVPDFTGVTEADARANGAASHVAVLVAGREGAAGRRPGTVVRQSIPPGQRVPKDHPVNVVLADEFPKVPKVVGLVAADAALKLEQAGFKVSTGSKVPDATVPDGAVISQEPGPDEAHEKGGSVVLRVSAGPQEVEVPRVTGSVVQRAKADLEKVGLKPKVEWVSVAESQGLLVLRQTPAAGQKAKPGTEVTIVANQ